MDTYADDLPELIEKPGLKSAILIGFSAGGGEPQQTCQRSSLVDPPRPSGRFLAGSK
jgi:hypothetical protein